MKRCILLLLILLTEIHLAQGHLRSEESGVITGVKNNPESLIFELSKSPDEDCQSLIVLDSTNQPTQCKIRKIFQNSVECALPLTLVNGSNLEEIIPQKQCLIKCGTYCGQSSSIYRVISEQAPLFSFEPTSGSFVYPSHLTIRLVNEYNNIESVYLQKEPNTIVHAFILQQSSKLIKTIIKGGTPGDFTVNVKLSNGQILQSSSTFAIRTKVLSLQPTEGTINGGVILEIQCENCSPREKENTVTIGSASCKILSASSTLISCIIEVDPANRPQVSTPLPVIISSGDFFSETDPSTTFTFVEYSFSPTITQMGSNIKGIVIQGETVVVSGTNLQIPNEKTVLRIGEFYMDITALTPSQLNFTVPFDMPPEKRALIIYVGKYGSTEQHDIFPTIKLLSSQCLNKGTYNFQDQERRQYLFIDLNLSNYDSTYTLKLTLDDNIILIPTVTQSSQNKNQVNIQFELPYFEVTKYLKISAITIAEINVLDTPIPLKYIRPDYQNIISGVTFEKGTQEGRFLMNVKSDFSDLIISHIVLKSYGMLSVDIEGTAQNGQPLSFSLEQIISFYNPYGFYLVGCSNKGSFFYETFNIVLPQWAFYQGKQTWELVNSPFPEGKILSGQQFSAHFSDFDIKSNVLCLTCSYYNAGVENRTEERYFESLSNIGNNIHLFEIPQFPQTVQISDTVLAVMNNCTMSLQKKPIHSNFLSYLNASLIAFPVKFQENSIIEIISIAPTLISYLGEEEIILEGRGLKDTSIDKVLVTIFGVPCNVIETTSTNIRCISGAYSQIQSLPTSLNDNIIVYQKGIKANINNCTVSISFRLIDPIPLFPFMELEDNTGIYIPHGAAVIMDDPELLSDKILTYDSALIEGKWVFESNMNFSIVCNKVLGQGMLVIGSEEHPFINYKMSFTVKNSFQLNQLIAFGDTHSNIVSISESALQGQNTLKVSSDIISQQGFRSGDLILVTGTTLGSKEEKLIIDRVNADSFTVTTALEYDHICINENIALKDSTETYRFYVCPSLLLLSKTVVLNLSEISEKNNELPFNFNVHGVELNYKIDTYKIDNYYVLMKYATINATKSIMDFYVINSLQYSFEVEFRQLESSLIYFDWKKGAIYGSAKNNIFIGKNQFELLVSQYQQSELISNVFQTMIVYIKQRGFYDILFKDNTIYNTEKCLSFLVEVQQGIHDEFIKKSILLGNNKCLSCMTAIGIAPNSFFKSEKYSLVAMDIRNVAVQINSFYYEFYGEDYSYNYYPIMLRTNYTLIEANMVFKQTMSGAVISNSSPPKLFYMNISDLFQTIGFSNIEFIDFQEQLVGSKLSSFKTLLQLKQIKNSFVLNSPTFDSGSQLIIHDIDGSFTGNTNTRSNIFESSLNFQSPSSCVSAQQQSDLQICQNFLVHFNQTQLLVNSEKSYERNILKFKRSNGQVIQGSQKGFFLVSGEVYEATLENEQGNARQFQTVSLYPDYNQNDQLAVLIKFPVQPSLASYFVAKVSILSTSQLTDISPSSQLIQSENILSIQNCTHGQSYNDGNFVQICFKSENVPLTLQFLSFPDVIPSKAEEMEETVRKFEEAESWLDESGKTTQSDSRWTIKPSWNMVLSKGGVYDLPGLVVQGYLEITGNEDIIINTKGIYVGSGVIKIASKFTGKLFLNFRITDATEVVFRNPYQGGQNFYQGAFMVYNKLIIENSDTINNSLKYRVKAIIDAAQVLLEEVSTQFEVGDEVLFACPITGQTLLTTITELTSSNAGTTIRFNENHGYSEQGFESITVASSKYILSPYLSNTLNKRIQIANANIIAENFFTQYTPSISISGVQFENSSITLNRGIGSITIQSSVFLDKSATLSNSNDYYISIYDLYNYYSDKPMNSSIKIVKNVFFSRNFAIKANAMVDYYLQTQIINPIPLNQRSTLTLEFSDNFIAKVSTAVTSLVPFTLFSKNIVIQALDSGISSSECFSVSFNDFYQCARVAIDMPKCTNVTSNLVAMSGAVYSSQIVTQILNLVSIGNQQLQSLPTQFTDQSILPKFRLSITSSYFIGDLSQIVSPNGACTPKKTLIPLGISSDTAYIFVPEVIIKDSFFAYFKCTKIIDIPNDSYSSSLSFVNSQCVNCLYNGLSDIFGVPQALSPSFLAQDYQSKFFSSIPFSDSQGSDQSIVITQSLGSLSLSKVAASNILSRLFISQLKNDKTPQTFTAEEDPSYNTQVFSDEKGTVLLLALNKLYSLTSSTILEKNAFRLSSPNALSKEYIQIKYQPQDGNGLLIQKSSATLLTSPGLDSSKGFDILNLVSNDESKISCGINIYDNVKNEYYIVITNDDDCLIRIFEYATPKISIVISTPTLPPPPPEQLNMCLAERQRLYILEKLSIALGVSKKRIRIILQSNSGSCSSQATRILAESDTLSFTFVVDSEANSSDSETDNCLINPSCSTSQRDLQTQASQAQNINVFYASASLQETALSQGLLVSSVQSVLPSVTTSCTGSTPFQLGSTCVASCDAGYFAEGYVCIKCHLSCQTCTGQSEYECTSAVDSSGAAVLDCSDGYQTFVDSSSNKKYCGKCPANCQTCLQSKCPSSSCNPGYNNQNGYCLLTCLSGYFNHEGVCIQCLPQCKNSCSLGTCTCSDGFYFKSSSTSPSCNTCPSQCATCSSENICLTCSEEKNEPKLLCVTEKLSGSEDSQNNLPLIIGLVSGAAMAIVIIGVVGKIVLLKRKSNKVFVQGQPSTVSAKATAMSNTNQPLQVIQLDINNEELIPLE